MALYTKQMQSRLNANKPTDANPKKCPKANALFMNFGDCLSGCGHVILMHIPTQCGANLQ
ncbi:MAG TPA: hypothetical protein DDZ53_07730 [Firmicutes bacterium]|nr:hypothetical protein [Bacillota bacterium]